MTEREAIAMMTQKLEPPGLKRDAHRVLYRCPKVQNALNSFGDVELRRCRLCCRRDRIAVHHDCNFDCEIRFDAMAARRQERVQNFDCFTNRYQKAITVAMMRRGVSCASIASTPLLGMARELIQIGIDAQASIPGNHAKLQARDIAIDFSRTSIELEVRRLAAEETEMIVKTYQQGKYANMKDDAGTDYYYYYYARLHYVLRTSCLPSLRAVIACFACVSASSCGLAPPLLRSLFFDAGF